MPYTVTIWGTRGSIPTPGAQTVRYGGNTACVAVEAAGQLVILDAGTGIRQLGTRLSERNGAVRAEILLSHTHWDHIQGLPHFKPFFSDGNEIRIRASQQGAATLDTILRLQQHPAVFPVPLDALSAQLQLEQVEAGEFTVGPFRVRAVRLRHPGTTLGFRLTPVAGGASLAYVTDNELGPGGQYDVPATWRREFLDFLAGADVVIHDAMYTPAELETHRGWGHSTYAEALTAAAEAGVKRLVLFHHEPEHGDDTMDGLVADARRAAEKAKAAVDVTAAQEGQTLNL
jgi:phosphoribosyl 1,2-cyclic phosphodiesterase